MFWVGIVIGTVIGGCIGMLALALLVGGRVAEIHQANQHLVDKINNLMENTDHEIRIHS